MVGNEGTENRDPYLARLGRVEKGTETDMRKMTIALAVAAMTALWVGTAFAGGPANKATGSGTWLNGENQTFYAEFNAHEAVGNRSTKGTILQERADGQGGFTVDVKTVKFYDGYACLGGVIDGAWGGLVDTYPIGDYRWTLVVDGGEGAGSEGDYLRGANNGNNWKGEKAPPKWCDRGDPGGNEAWSSGNVQIHTGR